MAVAGGVPVRLNGASTQQLSLRTGGPQIQNPMHARGAPAQSADGDQGGCARSPAEVHRTIVNEAASVAALLPSDGGDINCAALKRALAKAGVATPAEAARCFDSIAAGAMVVSTAAFWGACDAGSRAYVRSRLLGRTARKVAFFLFVQLPVVIATLAAVLGGLLAAVEGWGFADGFWLVVMELSGVAVQLNSGGSAPASAAGKLAAAFVGVVAIAVFGAVLAVMGGELIAPLVTLARCAPPVGGGGSAKSSARKLLLLALVHLPCLALLLSALFALVLAAAEGSWSYQTAFYVCLQEVTMTDTSLVPNSVAAPTAALTKVLVALVSTWATAIFGGAALGVMSGALVEPVLEVLRLNGADYAAGEPPPLAVDALRFDCDNDCGFNGTNSDVEEHEARCTRKSA